MLGFKRPALFSGIAIGFGQGKSIGKMPHLSHPVLMKQHLHNVEAKCHTRILEQFEVIQGGLAEMQFLGRVHSGGGTGPILPGACFNLNKDETIPVPKHQVNLAPGRTKIGREKPHASAFEKFFGGSFPHRPPSKMFWLGFHKPFESGYCQPAHTHIELKWKMKKKNEIVLGATKGLALDTVFPIFTPAARPFQGWGMGPPLEKIRLLAFGIHGMCEETGWRPRA